MLTRWYSTDRFTKILCCLNPSGTETCSPGVQDSLVLSQLSHEGGVWLSYAAFLLDKVVGLLQRPAVLFHGVRDDRGGRAAHPHLTVHQAFGTFLPIGQEGPDVVMSYLINPSPSSHCPLSFTVSFLLSFTD